MDVKVFYSRRVHFETSIGYELFFVKTLHVIKS